MRLPIAVLICASVSLPALAETPTERGLYLVTLSGCNDCHTPGALMGKPDETQRIAGSDVGFGDPASGVVVGPNLTPDRETGLGSWSDAQIIAALTRGVDKGGRKLSPVMPWPALSHLTPEDASAIVAYLRSLPPVKRATPDPFKPGEPVSVAVSVVVPPSVYKGLPNPMPAK